jgi:SRSO17 transposase
LAWLRDLTVLTSQACGMLAVMEDARVRAGDGHAAWSESFNEMFAQAAGVFGNAAVRRHGRAYLLGLLSHTERKNSWSLAEFAGEVSPDGMQRLLNFSPWGQDACRDAVRRYVVRDLGDAGAVLAVDETGFLKKGRMSAGVARMYTGTAGRVENCQVGVFLAYAAPDDARALIDRELYLPQKRTADRDRCRAAGIADDVPFATRPQLARTMIERAVMAGIPFGWVAGDEVYGATRGCADGWRRSRSATCWPWPATRRSLSLRDPGGPVSWRPWSRGMRGSG